ncbi:MAG: hypothetical protein ABIJ09_24315 [Pseudomonadota bacterium]
MTTETQSLVARALHFAVTVDALEIKADVAALREAYPGLDNKALSKKILKRAAWTATGAGVLTGLPSNPFAAIPAAIADAGFVLRTEVKAAARVALIYDPHFLDDEDACWELLIPIFGIDAASQALRELGMRGGMNLSRAVVRKYLSKATLKAFKSYMLKYFGLKVTQKAVITKTVPVVGGLIGGTWNHIEVKLLGKRVIAYFEKP